MNIVYRNETLIFDGSSNNFDEAKNEVSFNGFTFKVTPQTLTSLAQLPKDFKDLNPDE
jgi:hypothetical protein